MPEAHIDSKRGGFRHIDNELKGVTPSLRTTKGLCSKCGRRLARSWPNLRLANGFEPLFTDNHAKRPAEAWMLDWAIRCSTEIFWS